MDYEDRIQQLRRDLGARLKRIREDKRMSQAQVAARLGEAYGKPLPASRIGNYEQGTRLPNPIDIMLLAMILETTESALYGFEDGISSDERALLGKYRQTDERGKKTIQGIAEAQPPYLSGHDKEGDDGDGHKQAGGS